MICGLSWRDALSISLTIFPYKDNCRIFCNSISQLAITVQCQGSASAYQILQTGKLSQAVFLWSPKWAKKWNEQYVRIFSSIQVLKCIKSNLQGVPCPMPLPSRKKLKSLGRLLIIFVCLISRVTSNCLPWQCTWEAYSTGWWKETALNWMARWQEMMVTLAEASNSRWVIAAYSRRRYDCDDIFLLSVGMRKQKPGPATVHGRRLWE